MTAPDTALAISSVLMAASLVLAALAARWARKARESERRTADTLARIRALREDQSPKIRITPPRIDPKAFNRAVGDALRNLTRGGDLR